MPRSRRIRRGNLWSGTISFGLVSIPIELVTAKRSTGPTLKMVSSEGEPLKKAYFCSLEDKRLRKDDIIRGYEHEKNTFIPVEDEELENLAPEKSNDIEIDAFIPLGQINPLYFDHSYYVVPAKKSSGKPYLLLREAMIAKNLAGLATFVMRGKERIVAIFPSNGLLHAQTLRYPNEIRAEKGVDVPKPDKVDAKLKAKMVKFLKANKKDFAPEDELVDEKVERLQQLAQKKAGRKAKKSKAKKKTKGKSTRKETVKASNVVDIMNIIEKRLADEPLKKGG